jgi:hypothetical protein
MSALAPGFPERMRRVEELVTEIEASADVVARERAREVVRALLDLHAAGLARMIELARAQGGPAATLVEAWAREAEVGSLLLLHGLHPAPLAERVRAALQDVGPALRRLGADLHRADVEGDVVRVTLAMEAGCGANPAAARAAVEEALCAAAPDASLDLAVETRAPAALGFVPLSQLVARRS